MLNRNQSKDKDKENKRKSDQLSRTLAKRPSTRRKRKSKKGFLDRLEDPVADKKNVKHKSVSADSEGPGPDPRLDLVKHTKDKTEAQQLRLSSSAIYVEDRKLMKFRNIKKIKLGKESKTFKNSKNAADKPHGRFFTLTDSKQKELNFEVKTLAQRQQVLEMIIERMENKQNVHVDVDALRQKINDGDTEDDEEDDESADSSVTRKASVVTATQDSSLLVVPDDDAIDIHDECRTKSAFEREKYEEQIKALQMDRRLEVSKETAKAERLEKVVTELQKQLSNQREENNDAQISKTQNAPFQAIARYIRQVKRTVDATAWMRFKNSMCLHHSHPIFICL